MGNDDWVSMPFTDAVTVNPSISFEKGKAYPFVEMAAVDPGTRSVCESEYREFESGGARFAPGDTLMARITPCLENGKIARFRPSDGTSIGFGSTEFIVIRGKEDVTTDDFAYYLTKWDEFRQFAIGQMTGSSGRQRVPADSLAGFEATIPPLPVQRRIAHVLGTLDGRIELNQRMNRTLEKMAAAIFKSWFIDFLPVRAKMAAKQQDDSLLLPQAEPDTWFVYALACNDESLYIGQTEDLRQRWLQHRAGKGGRWTKAHPPQRVAYWERQPSREAAVERENWLKTGFGRRWLKKEIAAIARTQTGDPVHAKAEGRLPAPQSGAARQAGDPGLPAKIADLFPDSFEDSALGPIPKGWTVSKLGDLIELAYGKSLRAQDRLLGPVAVYGSNGQVGWHDAALVTGPGIVVGRKGNPGIVTWTPAKFFPIDKTFYVVATGPIRSLYFLFHALRNHNLASLGADSAVPGLNRNMAYMSKQIVPPSDLVSAFDSFVKPLCDRIYLCERQNRRLAGLRDTLLPKLLSGEIELPAGEAVAEEVK